MPARHRNTFPTAADCATVSASSSSAEPAQHGAVGVEAGVRGEAIEPLRWLATCVPGALGLEQLRQVGSLNPEARGLPVEDGEPDAAPVAQDAQVLGDEVAVNQRPGKRVAEGGHLAPARLEHVELGQEVLEDQRPVRRGARPPQLPLDLLARVQEVDQVVPRSPVRERRGPHELRRHEAGWLRASARPGGGAPAPGANSARRRHPPGRASSAACRRPGPFRSSAGWAWAGSEAVPRRRRSRPPRSSACRSLRSRAIRPGLLPRAGRRRAFGTACSPSAPPPVAASRRPATAMRSPRGAPARPPW